MTIIPFVPDHLRRLQLQPSQAWCAPMLDAEMIAQHAELPAWTMLDGDEPVAVAGTIEIWPERAIVWAYLSSHAGRHMVALTRAAQRYLAVAPQRRVEAYVETGFEAGHRWIQVLGFEREGVLRAFYQGRDMTLYSRIR